MKESKNISIFIRLFSTFPYLLPLLEGFQDFGNLVLQDYPLNIFRIYKKTFLPYVAFYSNTPWLSIIIFFLLYYFIVSAKGPIPIHRLLKFNTLQAIILYMVIIVFANIFRLFPTGFKFSLYGSMVSNTLFWFVLTTVIYSFWHIFKGTYAQIPVISEGAKMHIDFGID